MCNRVEKITQKLERRTFQATKLKKERTHTMLLLKIKSQKTQMKLVPPIDDVANCEHAQVKLAPLMMLQVESRDCHVITNNNVVEC
jgi:uncharacterized protein YegJ (DUF2314 family)